MCTPSAPSSNPEGSASTFVLLLTGTAIRHGSQQKHRDPRERERDRERDATNRVLSKTRSHAKCPSELSEARKKGQNRENLLTFLSAECNATFLCCCCCC